MIHLLNIWAGNRFMTKQKFTKLSTELVSIKKDEEALNKAFTKFEPDFNCISFGRYETIVVKCLEEAMKDKYEWISYFLYEMNCKFSKKPIGTYKNKKKLYIRNYDELYDLINNKDL